MRRTSSVSLLLAWFVLGCSSTSVSVDRDSSYDFAGKQTYAWKEGVPAENELNEKRIVRDVDEALAARGFRLVDEGQCDLWLRTEVSTRQEIRSTGGTTHVGVTRGSRGRAVGVGTGSGGRVYEVDASLPKVVAASASKRETVESSRGPNPPGNAAARNIASTMASVGRATKSDRRSIFIIG